MDLNTRYELNQELGEVSEWARYYEYHGRADAAEEYYRRIRDVEKTIARVDLIDQLRDFADFLENEPGVPVNSKIDIHYSVLANDLEDGSEDAKRAEVDRVAAILGVTPALKADGEHYTAMRAFGPVEYHVTAITEEHMTKIQASDTYYGQVTP
ncbi:hypothetical protein OHA25_27365 [Nonomuraea sp. NBC_00507]|uniref:hypothetical protein n=1 Tax=Nonomuraea sp. NBC_00507 TaxID=2976002 RepID=UPI002E189DD0